jgi:hypothetical protein
MDRGEILPARVGHEWTHPEVGFKQELQGQATQQEQTHRARVALEEEV